MASGRLAVPKRHIVRRLRTEGFELQRQVGSHQQWKNYHLKRSVTIPDKPELVGNQVRTIYEQAGWPWRESMTNDICKQKLEAAFTPANDDLKADKLPVPHVPLPAPPPPADVVGNEQPVQRKKHPKGRRRTAEEIELIGIDMLERPDMSVGAASKRWDMSISAIKRIYDGEHLKLTEDTANMLQLVNGPLSIAGVPHLVRQYEQEPEKLPLVVRQVIQEALGKKKPLALPLEKPSSDHEAEARSIVSPPQNAPSPPQAQPPQPEIAVFGRGYAPQCVGDATVQVGDAVLPLRDVLRAVQRAMPIVGLKRVVVRAKGDITVERQEIL